MSNQGFQNVPGVPDGWELVAIRIPMKGEWFVSVDGKPFKAEHEHGQIWPIIRPTIRKIEVPKQYRAFANAAEAEPFFDERLRWKGDEETRSSAIYRISVMDDDSVFIGHNEYGFREVFELFTKSDGTPFGVEVTE